MSRRSVGREGREVSRRWEGGGVIVREKGVVVMAAAPTPNPNQHLGNRGMHAYEKENIFILLTCKHNARQ